MSCVLFHIHFCFSTEEVGILTIAMHFIPHIGVNIYVLDENNVKGVTFKAYRPKEIVKVTLCLWVYINANTGGASVLSFGDKLQLKIYYGNDFKFNVNFYNWNR